MKAQVRYHARDANYPEQEKLLSLQVEHLSDLTEKSMREFISLYGLAARGNAQNEQEAHATEGPQAVAFNAIKLAMIDTAWPRLMEAVLSGMFVGNPKSIVAHEGDALYRLLVMYDLLGKMLVALPQILSCPSCRLNLTTPAQEIFLAEWNSLQQQVVSDAMRQTALIEAQGARNEGPVN